MPGIAEGDAVFGCRDDGRRVRRRSRLVSCERRRSGQDQGRRDGVTDDFNDETPEDYAAWREDAMAFIAVLEQRAADPNRAPGERSRFADAARRGRESVIWLAAVQDATDMGDYEALERLVELEQRRSDLYEHGAPPTRERHSHTAGIAAHRPTISVRRYASRVWSVPWSSSVCLHSGNRAGPGSV